MSKILTISALLEEGKNPKLLRAALYEANEIEDYNNDQSPRGPELKSITFGKDTDAINWTLGQVGMLDKRYSNIKSFTPSNFHKTSDGKVYIPVIIANDLLTDNSCRIYYYKESDKNESTLTLYEINLPNINPAVRLSDSTQAGIESAQNTKIQPSELILLEDWLEFTEKLASETLSDINSNSEDNMEIYYEVYGTDPKKDIVKYDISSQKEVFIQGIHLRNVSNSPIKFKQDQNQLSVNGNRFKPLARGSFEEQLNKDSYVPQLFENQHGGYSLSKIKRFLEDRPKPTSPSLFSRLSGRVGGNVTKKKKAGKKLFRKTLRNK